MRLFKTSTGQIGRSSPVEWLLPDALNIYRWVPQPGRFVDWDDVQDLPCLTKEFTEIDKAVYMKTNELQEHRGQHDPAVVEIASETDRFTRAAEGGAEVRDIHEAVSKWPKALLPARPGYRLWETINRIEKQAKEQEDEKAFISGEAA